MHYENNKMYNDNNIWDKNLREIHEYNNSNNVINTPPQQSRIVIETEKLELHKIYIQLRSGMKILDNHPT
jgi:hypothetical protein